MKLDEGNSNDGDIHSSGVEISDSSKTVGVFVSVGFNLFQLLKIEEGGS